MAEQPTIAEITVAQNALENMERTLRGLQGAKDVLAVLVARNNLAAELDRQIGRKRETLADLEKQTVETFEREAKANADRIVAEADAKAKGIIDAAKLRKDEIDTIIAGKRAELAAINAQLDELRQKAATIAG
jgi:hypothetical protein